MVAEAAAPDATGPFGLPVLEQLTELIGVDHALAYIEYDLDTQAWTPASVEYPVVEYPAGYCDRQLCDFNPLREEAVGEFRDTAHAQRLPYAAGAPPQPFRPRGAAARGG